MKLSITSSKVNVMYIMDRNLKFIILASTMTAINMLPCSIREETYLKKKNKYKCKASELLNNSKISFFLAIKRSYKIRAAIKRYPLNRAVDCTAIAANQTKLVKTWLNLFLLNNS